MAVTIDLTMASTMTVVLMRSKYQIKTYCNKKKVNSLFTSPIGALSVSTFLILKNCTYCGQVVLDILMTRGILEQRACLDTLLALLVDCSENQMVRSTSGIWKTLLILRKGKFFQQLPC